MMDYSKITEIEVDGIDHSDFPDFVDAFIANAYYNDVEMTEMQLEELNEDRDFVYECTLDSIF
tara:strand:+ start:300 stop:488 length:189 start_codon:yes stop_codon:yes gene_type:complete